MEIITEPQAATQQSTVQKNRKNQLNTGLLANNLSRTVCY